MNLVNNFVRPLMSSTNYLSATWDSPPREDDPRYGAFQVAFKRFVASRLVVVPKVKKDFHLKQASRTFTFKDAKPDLGQDSEISLMPFQVTGVEWLCSNYLRGQNCILADEMGLVSVLVYTNLTITQ